MKQITLGTPFDNIHNDTILNQCTKFSSEQRVQMGRLIATGEIRQRVAIISDVDISTLYKKFQEGFTNRHLKLDRAIRSHVV